MPPGVCFAALGLAAVFGVASGQEKVEPATLCEVLANVNKFVGKSVAILGRLDCRFSFESMCYLAQDRYEKELVLDGQTWPNKIWIKFNFPATPKSNIEIDPTILNERISALRSSTKLGTHRVLLFKSEDGVFVPYKWGDRPDEWGVAYGRILATKSLRHYSGAWVALEVNPNDLRSFEDQGGAAPVKELLRSAQTTPPAGESDPAVIRNRDQQLALWLALKEQLNAPDGGQYFSSTVKNATIPGMIVGVKWLKGFVAPTGSSPRRCQIVLSMRQGGAPEVTLNLTDGRGMAINLKVPPSPGTEVEFNGIAKTFTQNPFMLVLDVELPSGRNLRLSGRAVVPSEYCQR